MNLHKKCRKCREFFKAELMSLEFFCNKEECREEGIYGLYRIKRTRHFTLDLFDIYDLDRPILTDQGTIISYERVCRICGNPLFNKDGKYSYNRRYCGNCTGYSLWVKYNWGEVSKRYAKKVSKENKPIISEQFIEKLQDHATKSYYKEKPIRIKRDLRNLTICEECKKLCHIYADYWIALPLKIGVVNIHHKIPIHTLTEENIHLIWEESNLMALCSECHNKQDHQLKSKVDPYINFKKITNFI